MPDIISHAISIMIITAMCLSLMFMVASAIWGFNNTLPIMWVAAVLVMISFLLVFIKLAIFTW